MFNFFDKLNASAPENLDRIYVSPAGGFGSYNPGDAQGKYRASVDIALFDEQGKSEISGADFALAIVDEIENPAHHQVNVAFAY